MHWPKEVWAAIVTGLATATGSLIALIGVLVTNDKAPHTTLSQCIEVLDQLDNFLDKDQRNVRTILEKHPDGQYVVELGALEDECGLRDPELLDALSPGDAQTTATTQP